VLVERDRAGAGGPRARAPGDHGHPEAPGDATWTYRDTVAGVAYDLSGVLMKPPGEGPFPAVIVSHGYGGSAAGYARNLGAKLVPWGLVVIAPNYTHAGGGPAGSPGGTGDLGGSAAANVQRARRALAILEALGYIDITRLAAHGHRMGAFVTTALAGAHPGLLRVASHTAGGVRADQVAGPAPAGAQARTIRTPYQLHHGDRDQVVALAADQRLDELLQAAGTAHELLVYPGFDHNQIPTDALMLGRVRAWYARHGLF
jgi:dienelactone hydrolase